jgi:Family of unknown function (DUF6518)
MAYLVAAIAGLLFGAADQYFGSRSTLLPWSAGISGMSALWLALPFLVGMTQTKARRAIALGLVATLAALAGYFAMTYSPMENVPTDRFFSGVARMVSSGQNPFWILGGLVTGPLFGFLGHRWRVSRSWASAALITAALCLEPLLRGAVGQLTTPARVWGAEVAAGIVVGAAFAVSIATSRPARQPTASS